MVIYLTKSLSYLGFSWGHAWLGEKAYALSPVISLFLLFRVAFPMCIRWPLVAP